MNLKKQDITTSNENVQLTRAEFIDVPNKNFADKWSGVLLDWIDYGEATLQIRTGATITVVFDANVAKVGPSLVATSTSSVAIEDLIDWMETPV